MLVDMEILRSLIEHSLEIDLDILQLKPFLCQIKAQELIKNFHHPACLQ